MQLALHFRLVRGMDLKSRINLYTSELRPKKEFLTLKNIALSWMACLLLFGIVAFVMLNLANKSSAELAALQAQVKLTKNQITELSAQLQKKQDKSHHIQKLTRLDSELEKKLQLISFIENKKPSSSVAYSKVMNDLARLPSANISLKRFRFAGTQILLQGVANRAQHVPQWMEMLKQSEYFAGKEFSQFTLNATEQTLYFEVSTKPSQEEQ